MAGLHDIVRRDNDVAGPLDQPLRDLHLRHDDDLVSALDPRRAASRQLSGAKARHNDELKRAHACWWLHHGSFVMGLRGVIGAPCESPSRARH